MAIHTIVGFRHGETDLNAQDILQGSGIDIDLNDRGKTQALTLAPTLVEICSTFDGIHILTSDLRRAVQTIELVHEAWPENLKSRVRRKQITSDLRERNYGSLEGQHNRLFATHESFQKYLALETLQERQLARVALDIENDIEIIKRFRKAVDNILKVESTNPANDVLLLSTHGSALTSVLCAVTHDPVRRRLKNCDHVTMTSDQWQEMFMAA